MNRSQQDEILELLAKVIDMTQKEKMLLQDTPP